MIKGKSHASSNIRNLDQQENGGQIQLQFDYFQVISHANEHSMDVLSCECCLFSPSGKLVQIEYALSAVAAGSPSVGIKGMCSSRVIDVSGCCVCCVSFVRKLCVCV